MCCCNGSPSEASSSVRFHFMDTLLTPSHMIQSLSFSSSYPHGGYTSLGLFLTCALALSTTTYAVASCRMVVVTFTSSQGGFEEFFSDMNDREGETAARYKVGAGLFQWLRPFDSVNDAKGNNNNNDNWSNGYCVGYQSTMLTSISDTPFETARGFAVFAVLLAVIVTIWSMLSACISWNRIQIRLWSACLLAGAVCTGLTFLLKRAAICQSTFQQTECSIDQGGLMLVAAVILWLAAFMISVTFLKPDEVDSEENTLAHYPVPMPRKSSSAVANNSAPQSAPQRQQKANGSRTTTSSGQTSPVANGGSFDYSYDSRQGWTNPIPRRFQQRPQPPPPRRQQRQRPPQQQLTVDDVTNQEQMEVYMAQRLDRIEDVMRDDGDRSLRAEI